MVELSNYFIFLAALYLPATISYKNISKCIIFPQNKPLSYFHTENFENYIQNHISKCLLPNIFLNGLTDIRHF